MQARASGLHADGTSFVTGWYDLSARDGAAVHGALLPSHARQNVLRRAWDVYASSHDNDGRPLGTRGELTAAYLSRLATQRLERAGAGGPGAELRRIQVRARSTPVPPPAWSDEKFSLRPAYRTLGWSEAQR
ncbi:membrane protein [Streptomyces sp. SPB074]|nr:membrane protein [Streptomyces sp. SPB074]